MINSTVNHFVYYNVLFIFDSINNKYNHNLFIMFIVKVYTYIIKYTTYCLYLIHFQYIVSTFCGGRRV